MMISQPLIDTEVQYLTAAGIAQLEKRLRFLEQVRRPELALRLRQVIEEGTELVENTEYEATKNEQGLLEGEIARLRHILLHAEIIDEVTQSDVIVAGSRVTVKEKSSGEEETFQIVGSAEANPREGKISLESPAGRALLGARVGDKVRYQSPDGTVTFTVLAIH